MKGQVLDDRGSKGIVLYVRHSSLISSVSNFKKEEPEPVEARRRVWQPGAATQHIHKGCKASGIAWEQ